MSAGVAAMTLSTNTAQQEDEYVIFINEGDVVLVLANQNMLQVSSPRLSHASTVFKTTFGKKFKERHDSRSAHAPK